MDDNNCKLIFISHANPEDNMIAQWLSLQLAKEGYPVWCDLTKLLGGEDVWKNAEEAIRKGAIRFLYLLSKTSNVKDGPRMELSVARAAQKERGISNFIIPLKIDNLDYSSFNIEIKRLIAIDFANSWATGLQQLLEIFSKNGLKKEANFGPSVVSDWWRIQFNSKNQIVQEKEVCLSNWFKIKSLPEHICFHSYLDMRKRSKFYGVNEIDFPLYPYGQHLISFASSDDLSTSLRKLSVVIQETVSCNTLSFIAGNHPYKSLTVEISNNILLSLLRLGWEKFLRDLRLPVKDLSRRAKAFYFTDNLIGKDQYSFKQEDGGNKRRAFVGTKTIKRPNNVTFLRFWNFGIHLQPILKPFAAFIVKPHVFFSDDGSILWENDRKSHSARRSQCKNWWNDAWRDRVIGAMDWLAGDHSFLELEMGTDAIVEVEKFPVQFESPVSYADPENDPEETESENVPVEEDLDEEDDEVTVEETV